MAHMLRHSSGVFRALQDEERDEASNDFFIVLVLARVLVLVFVMFFVFRCAFSRRTQAVVRNVDLRLVGLRLGRATEEEIDKLTSIRTFDVVRTTRNASISDDSPTVAAGEVDSESIQVEAGSEGTNTQRDSSSSRTSRREQFSKGAQVECAICIEDFKQGDSVRDLRCGHSFHRDCVDKWLLERAKACPYCKQAIDSRKSMALTSPAASI